MNPRLLRVADRVRRVVWRVLGPRTVGVRGLVVDGDGRVLLVRHTYGPPTWHLPGGGVKRRESILDAVRRELREEAGVEVVGEPALLGVYSNLREGKSDHIAVFVVTEWASRGSDSAEIDSILWCDPDDLPPETTPATRRRIAAWRAGLGARAADW